MGNKKKKRNHSNLTHLILPRLVSNEEKEQAEDCGCQEVEEEENQNQDEIPEENKQSDQINIPQENKPQLINNNDGIAKQIPRDKTSQNGNDEAIEDDGEITPRMNANQDVELLTPQKLDLQNQSISNSSARRSKLSRATKTQVIPPRVLPSIYTTSQTLSISNVNSNYVSNQTSRAVGGKYVGRKNRKERCQQFSEKRQSIHFLPKVSFPESKAENYNTHNPVEVLRESVIVEQVKAFKEIGADDHLLRNFNIEQRNYVIKELYPTVEKAFQLFIQKSMASSSYQETIEKRKQVDQALGQNKPAMVNMETKNRVEAQTKTSFGSFKIQQQKSPEIKAEKPVEKKSSFGSFSMTKKPEQPTVASSIQISIDEKLKTVKSNRNPLQTLFHECLNDVINKRNSSISVDCREAVKPADFVQKIPDHVQMQSKRSSIFHKNDIEKMDLSQVPFYTKSPQQLQEIVPMLKKNFLTKNLHQDNILKLANAMKVQKFKADEIIIKYGDIGTQYFLLAKGCVKVIIYRDGTDCNDENLAYKIKLTKFIDQGTGFGELALLYNDKRSATVQAVDDVECYTLDGSIFKNVVIMSNIQSRTQKMKFLDQIPLFDQLERFQKFKIIDGLEPVNFKKGQAIIKEGDNGEEFYIIEKGKCEVLKLHERNGKQGFVLVRTLQKGDHFGELALIRHEPRSLTVRALENSELLRLDKATFERILGQIEKHLKMNYNNDFDQKMMDVIDQKRKFSMVFANSEFKDDQDHIQQTN